MCLAISTAALCGGCALPAQLEVYQPDLGGPQSGLHLESSWAHFARDRDDKARVLLAFPLPGARRGDKQYFVYLQFAGDAQEYVLDDQHPLAMSGFFEQVKGRYAGITQFESAVLKVQRDEQRFRGQFVAVCGDGTGLEGRFDARRDDWIVEQFEKEFEGASGEN
jgi:hypothetical protein